VVKQNQSSVHLIKYLMATKFDLYLYQRWLLETRSRQSSHQNAGGYTLLEILVVLGIVGILIAIAAPSLLAMQGAVNVNNSLEKVRSTLELSQIEAIKKKKDCTVSIANSTQMKSTCLIGYEAVDSSGNPVVQLDSGVSMSAADWTGTSEQVLYNGRGLTQNSGTIILGSSDTSAQKCLVINAGVGLLRSGNYNTSSSTCEIRE
jgi:prepilin-type N-terminal cleavage/methylation domain-containing protein